MARNLTEKQQKFLEVLFDEANGDAVAAKRLAGYGDNSNTTAIVESLKDEIGEKTRTYFARSAPKAAVAMVGATIQNAKEETLTLYNEAVLIYGEIDLKAGSIVVDYKKETLFAKGIVDSTGYTQRPYFKQGSEETEQDSLLYNFKSKRAIIYGLKTKQGEMFTYGEKTKRVNDSTICLDLSRVGATHHGSGEGVMG